MKNLILALAARILCISPSCKKLKHESSEEAPEGTLNSRAKKEGA